MGNFITTMYYIAKDDTMRESKEEVAADVLQVISLHFTGQFNRKGWKVLCGCSPSWVNHVILVSLLYCVYFYMFFYDIVLREHQLS